MEMLNVSYSPVGFHNFYLSGCWIGCQIKLTNFLIVSRFTLIHQYFSGIIFQVQVSIFQNKNIMYCMKSCYIKMHVSYGTKP